MKPLDDVGITDEKTQRRVMNLVSLFMRFRKDPQFAETYLDRIELIANVKAWAMSECVELHGNGNEVTLQ